MVHGGRRGNHTERSGIVVFFNSVQTLEITVLDGKKRNEAEPCGTASKPISGWGGIRTPGRFPVAGFQDRSLRPLGHPSCFHGRCRPVKIGFGFQRKTIMPAFGSRNPGGFRASFRHARHQSRNETISRRAACRRRRITTATWLIRW